ncbi:MAG: LacI family DNA-binding transcriptional regulator [Chloroflexi bacterium]|nr:LacI family DNA-binding transcriptional regulator [Chloroflexota bacterium]
MTIADVARRAAVSTATVSRVLAGLGGARPATRQRVEWAARDLGYRPSAIARSLKLRTTRTLGLVITDIENPFFPHLVRAVEDAAHERGYAVVLCNAADDPEREAFYLDLLVERRMDGVIIASSRLAGRHRRWLRNPPLPVVMVNATTPLGPPSVKSDDRGGGDLAAAHLIELGHQRLAVLTPGRRYPDAAPRLAGVRAGIRTRQAGVTLAVATGVPTIAGGASAMTDLLEVQGGVKGGVTGVIAYNDLMAIGAMRTIRGAGCRIPDDISVVGFDDIDVAKWTEPPLTTVAQSVGKLGGLAVERLTSGLHQPVAGNADRAAIARHDQVVVPVHLEIRASTGPAPA